MTSASEFNRRIRAAQQRAQREIDAHNRRIEAANKKAIDDYNRRAQAHNRQVIADQNRQNREAEAHNRRMIAEHNRRVDAHNRQADAHNQKVIKEINRRLSAAAQPQVRYTAEDAALVERVQEALVLDDRDYDVFLNYARIDGAEIAGELCRHLQQLGVRVWFDEIAIQPGKSQSLQMDHGLRKARAGVALLTPAYLTGRFWVERELGALLNKQTLIPVLHNVTFADVEQYSGILPDLAGFQTDRDTVFDIAVKIAAAVLPQTEADEAAS